MIWAQNETLKVRKEFKDFNGDIFSFLVNESIDEPYENIFQKGEIKAISKDLPQTKR